MLVIECIGLSLFNLRLLKMYTYCKAAMPSNMVGAAHFLHMEYKNWEVGEIMVSIDADRESHLIHKSIIHGDNKSVYIPKVTEIF